MNIKLLKLEIENFKGIKKFTFSPEGKNVDVHGDNGTGKTSLYDAMNWLLFGKDSQNKKDFSIKPKDSSGNDIHFLESSVEATLEVNGTTLTLKKMLKEKWVKKRGNEQQEFDGHETSYWIDEVPVKLKEYQKRIDDLISEDTFKMITNPLFFNTSLSWQDRRKTLFEISGELSDADVIQSSEKLSTLVGVLEGKSIEDYNKILNERIKKLKCQIESIPARIDELMKLIPAESTDYSAIEKELESKKAELAAIDEEIATASKALKEYNAKLMELSKAEAELNIIKNQVDQDAGKHRRELENEKETLNSKAVMAEINIRNFTRTIEDSEKTIDDYEKQINQKREEWNAVNNEVFNSDYNYECFACGQKLPDNKINDMKISFEHENKKRKDSINAEGKNLKVKIDQLTKTNDEITQKINQENNIIVNCKKRIEEIEKELKCCTQAFEIDYTGNHVYASTLQIIEKLKSEIKEPAETSGTNSASKEKINADIEELQKLLGQRDKTEQIRSHIEELKADEKADANKIAELEGHRWLIEEFTRQKVNLMTDSINSKFHNVRFKLFDEQINGGLSECCETLVNTNGCWVPWTDANNAGRINAGLDIINTLCKHYGFNAPVFVDNAESVTKLADIDSQVIRLVVDETSKQLTVKN